MRQPVTLSDALVHDARVIAKAMERSTAGQVEFWARLRKAVESVLDGQSVLKLRSRGDEQPLSACLEAVGTAAGRDRLTAYLESQPYPHYTPHPEQPEMFERIDQDGTRTLGRFVDRHFQPVSVPSRKRKDKSAR
jgi:hypothetical protein